MTTTPSSQRFSFPSIAMHWLMVLVFIGIYIAVNLIDVFPKGSDSRQWAKTIHFSLGLLVFGLFWLRVALRLLGNTPAIVPAPPAWQEKLAKLGHLALYAIMVLMPLVGWAALSARGKPIPFFGMELPALLAPDKALGQTLREVHELGGNLAYYLIGGHALAAIYHHYFMKDNTLLRMSLR